MSLTAKEINKYLGKVGFLETENHKLRVKVECVDVRESFGRLDVQVEPVDGNGSAWVSESRMVQWE